MKKGTVCTTGPKAPKSKVASIPHIPLNNRVIILQSEADNISDGGIIIPEMSQEQPNRGTVVAAGRLCEELKAGDRVEFGDYAGKEITLDGVEYLIMKETDIFLILK